MFTTIDSIVTNYNNRLVFKIKDGYKLELKTPEAMKKKKKKKKKFKNKKKWRKRTKP